MTPGGVGPSGETIHRCIGASRYAEQRYTYRYTWCRIDTLNASIQVFVFATSVCPVCKMTFFKAHFIGLAKTVYPGVQLLGSMAKNTAESWEISP